MKKNAILVISSSKKDDVSRTIASFDPDNKVYSLLDIIMIGHDLNAMLLISTMNVEQVRLLTCVHAARDLGSFSGMIAGCQEIADK